MAVGSIVDYLKSQGQDSSYSARKNLASQYGIGNYSGTASQNTQLLKQLQAQGASSAGQQAASPANVANGQNVTITPVSSSKAASPASEYITGYKYSRFSPSSKTQAYGSKLEDLEDSKPAEYSSKYDGIIDGLISDILNRKEFNTDDVYDSDLYKNYRDSYVQQGQKAMRDTMGQAAQLTGGYGSTYAQAAGQQAYDNYLSQLGDKTLDIYDRVYAQYLQEGQELYNRLGMVNEQDSIDYGRYRDTVGDYYRDLDYYSGRYDSSYNQDFGEYQSDLAQQQWAEEYAYQKTQDALAQQQWQAQFDYQKEQDALQYALQQQKMASSMARSGGGSGSGKSGTSSDKYGGYKYADLVAMAKEMLAMTDDNNEYLYDSGAVLSALRDAGVSEREEREKVLKAAGGNVEIGRKSKSVY